MSITLESCLHCDYYAGQRALRYLNSCQMSTAPQLYEQVAQLLLTNIRDALHHDKRQNFKQSRDHNG